MHIFGLHFKLSVILSKQYICSPFTVIAFGVARTRNANTVGSTLVTKSVTVTLFAQRWIKIALQTFVACFSPFVVVAVALARAYVTNIVFRAGWITVTRFYFLNIQI